MIGAPAVPYSHHRRTLGFRKEMVISHVACLGFFFAVTFDLGGHGSLQKCIWYRLTSKVHHLCSRFQTSWMDRLLPLNRLWLEHMNIFVNLILFSLFPIYLIVCVSVLQSAQLLVTILNFLFNVQLKPELLIKYWGVYRISSLIHFLLPPCSPFPPRPVLSIICHKLCRFLPLKTYCIQNSSPLHFLPWMTSTSFAEATFHCFPVSLVLSLASLKVGLTGRCGAKGWRVRECMCGSTCPCVNMPSEDRICII